MRILSKILALSLLVHTLLLAKTDKEIANSYKVLCYHNVVDKITDPKIMNITTDQLIAHFKWLKENGYNVISIDDILDAKSGKKPLAKKAVLLSFDDGYVSFYTRIYPLLKLYNYHAIYALVGKWQETPENQKFLYGTLPKSRKMLLSWDEVKEMQESGLVEFASHTYDFHHGIIANPQGNTEPALSTLQYDPKTKRYESIKSYVQRVEEDLKKSSDTIYKYTGVRPRSIAWPYGAYNGIAQNIAKKLGMSVTLTLDDGINTLKDIGGMKRVLLENNPSFSSFYWGLQNPDQAPIERSIIIDIDDIYDPDPKKTNINLGKAIEHVKSNMISTVIIKAYSDRDHDGLADMLYYPNDTLPMRADLLNRVTWQMKGRASVEDFYVQLPVSGFEINQKALSINKSSDQKKIMHIYADMAKQSFFKGIVFDARINKANLILKDTMHFTDALIKVMRPFTINLKTALILDSRSKDIDLALKHYNFTHLDLDPILKSKKRMKKKLSKLVKQIKKYPKGLEKCSFLLSNKSLSYSQITALMESLILNKALNLAFQPDDIVKDKKIKHELIKVFSLRSSPFE